LTAVREPLDVLAQAVSWGNVVIGIASGAGGVLVALGLLLIHLHRRR
jgi:hypothetical protein